MTALVAPSEEHKYVIGRGHEGTGSYQGGVQLFGPARTSEGGGRWQLAGRMGVAALSPCPVVQGHTLKDNHALTSHTMLYACCSPLTHNACMGFP